MILGISPVRISFAGGGTDMPEYYEKYGGSVISSGMWGVCNLLQYGPSRLSCILESGYRISYPSVPYPLVVCS